MKKYYIALLGVSLFSLSLKSQAQTADDIINKYLDAIGGKDKIAQIQSIVIDGKMQVMGADNPFHTTIIDGKGFKNELEFNGTKIVQCVTDNGGWAINPMAGSADAAAMAEDEFKSQKDNIFTGGPLYNYAAKGSKVELLTNEKVGDVDAQKIKLTNADGVEYNFWFDPKTSFAIKMTRGINGMETSIAYSDYRKTDFGITYPFASEITLPQGFTLNSAVEKVQFNMQVDPAIFNMGK